MRLVYKYNINTCQELLNLCNISKNLYNQALYEVKENLKNNKFIFYNDLNKIMINKNNLEGNINYKCQLVGINLIETEESYTSKCDALVLEKLGKHEEYSGKRKKRGLFQSGIKKLINVDVNRSINIMRKVVSDSYINKIIDSGLLFNPIKVRNLYDLNLL
jgi:hypothetical protein